MALIADLKSYDAAFQFSPVLVLSNPLPLVIPIFFFSSTLVCLAICALVNYNLPAIFQLSLLQS